MLNRRPTAPDKGQPIPDFTPVPLHYRHDGWTPDRQKAFIAALADTGSVSRATAMVNMSLEGVYHLRRMPGAESFRRAWEAALDFGVARLKDIAFERAIEGEMVPLFHKGKLMGFQRKRNDRLLMFCLRHYGQDASGKRTTINYFSTRASAGSAGGDGSGAGVAGAAAEASTTTMRTVISGTGDGTARGDAAADALNGFAGVSLDHEAQAEIAAALEACAARRRAREAVEAAGGDAGIDAQIDDPAQDFVRIGDAHSPFRGTIEFPAEYAPAPFCENEPDWRQAGAPMPDWALALPGKPPEPEPQVSEVRKRKPRNNWKRKKSPGHDG